MCFFNEVTKDWLVGQASGPPGFVALCLVKKQVLEFMFRAVHRAAGRQELQQSSEVIIKSIAQVPDTIGFVHCIQC